MYGGGYTLDSLLDEDAVLWKYTQIAALGRPDPVEGPDQMGGGGW